MWKTCSALAVLVILVGACAHGGDMPIVRAGNEPETSKARVAAARAAGAGTVGAQTFSGSGWAR